MVVSIDRQTQLAFSPIQQQFVVRFSYNDFNFLKTLDDRDWRSGIAEAVKVALIKDKAFFGWIDDRAVNLRDRDIKKSGEFTSTSPFLFATTRCCSLRKTILSQFGTISKTIPFASI